MIVNKDWPLVTKLWKTDLSHITSMLRDLYSDRGPEKGINEMKRTPIYAILSGFELQDIPGVGTFYDFFKRLWVASGKHLKPKKQKKRKSKPKKGKKGEKELPLRPVKSNVW